MAGQDLNGDPQSCAAWIARFLQARGIDRIFGLQGGHIQPIWDHVARLGIRIVDCRHEGAAVHMAHAHAELTGMLGVAMVTAGPGVTNTVTAIANASLARIPVLVIGGCTSRPQANMGPLQDIPHTAIIAAGRPLLPHRARRRPGDPRDGRGGGARDGRPRRAGAVLHRDPDRRAADPRRSGAGARRLDAAEAGAPICRRTRPRSRRRPGRSSRRGGRWWSPAAARAGRAPEILRLLDASRRGLSRHPGEPWPGAGGASVGGRRHARRGDGRGGPRRGHRAQARLPARLRLAGGLPGRPLHPHRRQCRRADRQPPRRAGAAGHAGAGARRRSSRRWATSAPATDRAWADGLRQKHLARSSPEKRKGHPTRGSDGKVHPAAIFDAIREVADPDYIAIADGGDLLSFARVGLEARTYSTPAPSAAWAWACRMRWRRRWPFPGGR